MNKLLAISCLFVAALVLGCSDVKAPNSPVALTSAHTEGQVNVTWTWLDATHIQKTYFISRYVHGQRVTIGPIKVVYVCDYPTGFMGPLPSGHCYTDGSGCID